MYCFFIHTTFAQSSLSGTLRNKQNSTPISGATVSLLQNGLHDHSNSNGRFSFKNVCLPDSLRVSDIGYQSKTINVVDSTSILQIIIEEALLELEQVIIMGSPLLASQLIKLDVDKAPLNSAHARAIEEPKGENYIPLVPSLTNTGGVSLMLTTGLSAKLRYRYMKSKPATEDNSIIAKGYFVNDLMLAYGKKNRELTAQVQNLFNTKWNEAQFETETRLRNETMSVSDLCYTPGTPVYLKVGASIKI